MHEGTTILGLLFMTVYSTSVILQSLTVFSMLNSGYFAKKIVFGQKFFSWKWFIWFHKFFWPRLFKIFCPTIKLVAERVPSGNPHYRGEMGWRPKKVSKDFLHFVPKIIKYGKIMAKNEENHCSTFIFNPFFGWFQVPIRPVVQNPKIFGKFWIDVYQN